jgi:hypothetical protein
MTATPVYKYIENGGGGKIEFDKMPLLANTTFLAIH